MSSYGEENETSSKQLNKQDEFWENIIGKYEQAIKQLRGDEVHMQEHLYALKVLIQAILTFNLIKLLDRGGDPQLINRLIQMKCVCPQEAPEEMPINMGNLKFIFDIENKDIKHMAIIKELINREKILIDEVNKLRIKDSVLVQMKVDMDNLMRSSFPTYFAESGSAREISLLPGEIQELLMENRLLADELYDLEKENRKSEDSLFGSLSNELIRLKRKNVTIERKIGKMKAQLKDVMATESLQVIEEILQKTRCVAEELRLLVVTLEDDTDLLKHSVVALKNIK